jgi:uncharacterized protein
MGKKRLFISLLGACICFFSLLIYYTWQLAFSGAYFYKVSFGFIILIFGLLLLLAGIGVAGLVWSILRGKDYAVFQGPMMWTLNLLYPLIMRAAKMFKITQDKIQASFIEVNNKLVEAKRTRVVPDKMLILLPHCLQSSDCTHKITGVLANCRGCGKCTIGDLKKLAEKYGVHMEVVPGGTLARRAVQRYKPAAVLAVACERDLSSGIMDSSPMPVYGILNERPNGPCFNTRVDVGKMEEAIKKYVEGGD